MESKKDELSMQKRRGTLLQAKAYSGLVWQHTSSHIPNVEGIKTKLCRVYALFILVSGRHAFVYINARAGYNVKMVHFFQGAKRWSSRNFDPILTFCELLHNMNETSIFIHSLQFFRMINMYGP